MTTPTKTVGEILQQLHMDANRHPGKETVDKARQSLRTLVEKAFDEVIDPGEPHCSHVCPKDNLECMLFSTRCNLRDEQRQRAKAKLTEMFGEE